MVVSHCLCLFILLTWIVICTLTSRHVSTYVLSDHTCKCEVSLQAHTFIIIKLIPCVASFSSQKQEGEITFSRHFVRKDGAPFPSCNKTLNCSILGFREAEKVPPASLPSLGFFWDVCLFLRRLRSGGCCHLPQKSQDALLAGSLALGPG